ncbi:MAG: bifunctional nicotinamidase/pyrazinamidase [Desulfobacteraceae bacterium]|nr:MAG: bifunctional nicotinamidase/pyrazinamidase [Desulfobacteraceae bacterium]
MKNALILVDIQQDFLPGGALAVPDGDAVVPVANQAMNFFDLVVATQDWHPANHRSFAGSHPGRKPGEVIEWKGMTQILWPDHCIQNTPGAAFAKGLNTERIDKIIFKGTHPDMDSYSGFFDNGHIRKTGLEDFLQKRQIKNITIMGLATDYCVQFTVLDACDLGFSVRVLQDGIRGVELKKGDCEKAISRMKDHGAEMIRIQNL